MAEPWRILVVDDEPDVHLVTKLALKSRKWRNRPFEFVSAHSAKEAREILEKHSPAHFQAALVDVVMESDTAGLELCRHIRAHCDRSIRIVLRTGQPGAAPKDTVLREFDIDFYLAKSEATPETLYAVLRGCIRSHEDISTMAAYGKQLNHFSRILGRVASEEDLLTPMKEGIAFLETKYSAFVLFVYDVDSSAAWCCMHPESRAMQAKDTARELLQKAASTDTFSDLLVGADAGLPAGVFVLPMRVALEKAPTTSRDSGREYVGGMVVEMEGETIPEPALIEFRRDALLFLDNWKIAFSTFLLQERLVQERMLRQHMQYERMKSLATMVAGVAHEMNTPLGVARTAADMASNVAEQMLSPEATPEQKEEHAKDFKEVCGLLTKNIIRTHELVKSFKQLSTSQLSDKRTERVLTDIIQDCITSMGPSLKKRSVTVALNSTEDADFSWDGFPGHLTQVIVNFIQNTLRYGYPEGNGQIHIDVSETTHQDQTAFCIQYRDAGGGIPADILPRVFEPFVTTGRGQGGSGLGLAICHNIVVELLKGDIQCTSKAGEGVLFTVLIPKVVPEQESADSP